MESNWSRTGKIIKETFAMAGKDKSLYIPPILNIVVGIIIFIMILFALLGGGVLGPPLAAFVVVLLFIGYLASAFLEAALSYMVLEVVQGKDTTLSKGLGRAFKKTGSLMIYALVSLIIMLIVSKLRDKDNQNFITMIIKSFFAGVIEEAWDIAGHFMLPAIALTDKNFGEAVKELPVMLKHLPQALVGGFAFDFIVGWVYLLCIVVAVFFGWIFASLSIGLGIIIGISLAILLCTATFIFYSFVKSVYFTMMYIDLHPELKKKNVK